MTALTLTILYTLFVWWFSTGAILWLDGLPPRTYRYSLAGASVVTAAALYGLEVSENDVSPTGAVIAFTSRLMIWGWL